MGEAVREEIADLKRSIAAATKHGWTEVAQMQTANLEKLKPGTKENSGSDIAKEVKIVATDQATIATRHEQTMRQYEEHMKN